MILKALITHRRKLPGALLSVAAMSCVPVARADSVLIFEMGGIQITPADGTDLSTFGPAFTGELDLNGSVKRLVPVIANKPVTGITYEPATLSGEVDMQDGYVSGGSVTVTLNKPGAPGGSYTCGIAHSTSPAIIDFDGAWGYQFASATENGGFSGSSFGSLGVGQWPDHLLTGSFGEFGFQPTGSPGTGDANVEFQINSVPFPPAMWAALPVLAGLGVWRIWRGRHQTAL